MTARTISGARLGAALRRWRMIIACAVIGGATAFGATYLAPPRYQATATIYALPSQSLALGAALRYLDLGETAAGLVTQGATTEIASYLLSILRSRAVAAAVCRRLDLAHEPLFAPRRRIGEPALAERLRQQVTAKADFAGLITIRAAARSPQLAADIANAYVAALDDFMCHTARSKRQFIESQLAAACADLARLERELQTYRARHRTYALDTEAKELIENWAQFSAEQAATEVALRENVSTMQVSGSVEDLVGLRSRRAGLEARAAALRRLVEQLQARLASLPQLGLGLVRLERKVAAKQALTQMLESELELARIAEVQEQARYQLLDRAYPPQAATWPRRRVAALTGMALGLMVGLLAALRLGIGQETIHGSPGPPDHGDYPSQG